LRACCGGLFENDEEAEMFVTIKGLNHVEHFINLKQVTRISYSGKDNVHVHFADGQAPIAISDSEATFLKASINTKTVEKEAQGKTELGNPWQVVLFNDEVHSFDEVILQIQKATGYSLEKATELTFRVHRNGKAVILIGSKVECEKVAAVLGQIRLIVQVEKT
jgi:ATP-dependent Clp protease adaptor protein ClpS